MPDADVKINVKLSDKPVYTVKFDSQGGTKIKDVSVVKITAKKYLTDIAKCAKIKLKNASRS
jgi:hypothetical protein